MNPTDFDLTVQDVLLAHEHFYPPGLVFAGYQAGRPLAGVVWAKAGEAVYAFADGTEVTLAAGALAFFPADVRYTVANRGGTDFLHDTINFTLAESPEPRVFRVEDAPAYDALFGRAVAAWDAKGPGYRLQCRACLYELLARFFGEVMTSAADARAVAATQPALAHMGAHFDGRVTVGELAALCSMSETHFRRRFKAAHRLSPMDYLLHLRLSKAKDLLVSGYYSVDEVARMTGFSDAGYLCRCFRARVGQSPGRFARGGAPG